MDNNISHLGAEAREFLASIDLFPYSANIWSWIDRPTVVWHLDCYPGHGHNLAINYLLQGDPGVTEWTEQSALKFIGPADDKEFGSSELRYLSIKSNRVDFKGSIRYGVPMLIRTDVPHRVDRSGQESVRWVYRILLRRISEPDKILTWETAEELLSAYFVE